MAWTVVKWLQIGKSVTPWGVGKGRTEATAKLGTKNVIKQGRRKKKKPKEERTKGDCMFLKKLLSVQRWVREVPLFVSNN
jgi:hypothetical protein